MPISSPGVNTREKDLTFTVQNVTTNATGYVMVSRWGPAEEIVEITTNEKELVAVFGQPDQTTTQSFHAAANALLYSVPQFIVRAIGPAAKNSVPTGEIALLVKNKEEAEFLNLDGIAFIGRYPGQLGNSLKISASGVAGYATWAYANKFSYKPTGDTFNLAVIDEDGLITGVAGTVIETYHLLSKTPGAKRTDGTTAYIKEVIKNQSSWVNIGDIDEIIFDVTSNHYEVSLIGGVDDNLSTTADYSSAVELFASREVVDIARMYTSFFPIAAKIEAIDLLESRGDAVAFTAPELDDVYNTREQVDNLTEYFGTTLNKATSYNFQVDNWKMVYDKYNDQNIWIPCDSDASGLHARLFVESSPWFSPAGYSRGQLKNVIRLAWNSNEPQRDILYPAQINSIISPKGEGTILFGDKTALSSPSAFNRINVRTLFIVMKKNIANFAKYQLFELNDYITRTLFKNACDKYLSTVKGGRGIYDFLVVCDETNNTGDIIDDNQFIGDLFVKPAKSINIINLNFVAVGTSVDFTEVEGA
jgi:hypothetical protein